MKEIKYRAWDTEKEVMAEVLSINLSDGEVRMEDEECRVWSAPAPYVCRLMQYIGLKDKNGTEIFEGDIVKRTYLFNGGLGETHTGEVVYDKEYARYVISRPQKHIEPKTEDLRNTLSDKSTYEVIGNIYENRELLEEI